MIKGNIKELNKYPDLSDNLRIALDYLSKTDFTKLDNGKYYLKDKEIYAIVQEYTTKPEDQAKFEAHRAYIDIQYMVRGREKIGYCTLDKMVEESPYDSEKDIVFFTRNYSEQEKFVLLEESDFAIFYPKDAHMPSVVADEAIFVKKVVMKISV